MAKLPWMLRELSVVSEHSHVCNRTCSHFYTANSYGEVDFSNTLTHEQRNAKIRKMEAILRGAGRYGYLALLCYHTSMLNSCAESRSVHQQEALAASAAHGALTVPSETGAGASESLPASLAPVPKKPRLTFPLHFDMRNDYFTSHACCCCGYQRVRDAPPQAC